MNDGDTPSSAELLTQGAYGYELLYSHQRVTAALTHTSFINHYKMTKTAPVPFTFLLTSHAFAFHS